MILLKTNRGRYDPIKNQLTLETGTLIENVFMGRWRNQTLVFITHEMLKCYLFDLFYYIVLLDVQFCDFIKREQTQVCNVQKNCKATCFI